jgi:uncharacterized protein YndB with AHSA1/START domain
MKLDLRLDERFERPIEAVWRALTDPRILARWLMDNDFALRVGHEFRLRDPPTPTWRGWVDCRVLEIEAPRRMVWSWDDGGEGEGPTRVVFELTADGAGTRLTLRHEGDAPEVRARSLGAGWRRKVGVLAAVLGPDYARRVAFRSAPERVFEAVATLEGIAGWWTPLVGGSPTRGASVQLRFEGLRERIVLRVDGADRPSSVRWTCVEHTGLEEWAGTRMHFEIAARGDQGSELCFRHEGLAPKLECYETCELGWDHFLGSLAAYVDSGRGEPFRAGRVREARAR